MVTKYIEQGKKRLEKFRGEWKIKKLADIGEPLIGLTYKPSNVKSEGTLVLRSSNVFNGTLRFDDNVYVDIDIPDKIRIRKGDILICVRNGSRHLIGKCAYIDENFKDMTFGAFMAIFRSPFNDFVFQQFQSNGIKTQIAENLGATINQITNKTLNSLEILFPEDPDERLAITKILSDTDALIQQLDYLITKKKNIKQGAMQELLTGKKRLEGFSEKWKIKKFGDVLKVKHGKSQKKISDEHGQYPILATGGKIGMTREFLYDKPSVLIGRKGTIDKPQYIDVPFWTIDTLFYTEIFSDTDPKFILYKFKSINWYSYNEASGVPSLNASTIENIEQQFPPTKEEQSAISQIISDMDAEIEGLERNRDKYVMIKNGMMQKLLTGEIRVK